MNTTDPIMHAAHRYGVSIFKLRKLVKSCPVDGDPRGDVDFDLDDLANLLGEMDEDVAETADLAHRLHAEFGYIPRDIGCVSEGGAQVMYMEIMHSS